MALEGCHRSRSAHILPPVAVAAAPGAPVLAPAVVVLLVAVEGVVLVPKPAGSLGLGRSAYLVARAA